MPRFELKYVSQLKVGEWAQVNGSWFEVLACETEPTGWTRLSLAGFSLPETTIHKSVEVPWSPKKPTGVA